MQALPSAELPPARPLSSPIRRCILESIKEVVPCRRARRDKEPRSFTRALRLADRLHGAAGIAIADVYGEAADGRGALASAKLSARRRSDQLTAEGADPIARITEVGAKHGGVFADDLADAESATERGAT